MPKTIRDILSIPGCECLRIVAGENGSGRPVNWTAAIEVTDIIRFSNEGDLNFATGLMIGSDEEFLEFVRKAYEHKMAGVVFAPGPYIKKIPQCVINFASDHDFPILTMPWEVKISTLSHKVGEFISGDRNQTRMPEEVWRSILLGKGGSFAVSELRDLQKTCGFTEISAYRVLVLRIVPSCSMNEEELSDICAKLIEGVNRFNFTKAIAVGLPSQIAVVLADDSAQRVMNENNLTDLLEMTAGIQGCFKGNSIRIGIGNCYGSIEQIAESYSEALLVTDLQPAIVYKHKNICCYDQLGAYKLIWECRNPEAMLKFSKEVLGDLINYDEINKTELMAFLVAYFKYDGNAILISEKLFLHKNTVHYKIKKIENILGRSFTSMDKILELKLSLMILDVYSEQTKRAV